MSKSNRIKINWEEPNNPQTPDLVLAAAVLTKCDHGTGKYLFYVAKRNSYCDRGRFLVHLDTQGAGTVDGADLFPRYYFNKQRMLDELEDFVNAREECRDAA
jgi:hypothetical protein